MERGRITRLTLGSILFLAVTAVSPAAAVNFCVGTAAELQAALSTAQSNGVSDVIQVRAGTYTGFFSYFSSEAKSLQILGGYVSFIGGCAQIYDDPASTVLQAPSAGEVLSVTLSGAATSATNPLLRVSRLSLLNGTRGLRLTNAMDTQSVDFEVSRNRILGGSDGGLLMNVIDGSVRIENNIVARTASDNQGVALDLSMPHVNSGSTLFVIQNTIVDNQALSGSSAIVSLVGAAGNEATFANNIIRDNGWVDLYLDPDVETTVYNNDYELIIGNPDFSSGNVDFESRFMDAAHDDFRPRADSQVRNIGHVTPPGGLPSVDIVGNPRIQAPLPDLGAYEVPWIFQGDFELGFAGWSNIVP